MRVELEKVEIHYIRDALAYRSEELSNWADEMETRPGLEITVRHLRDTEHQLDAIREKLMRAEEGGDHA